jgi:enoyl-CoA hydratase/carnithine racemase
MIPTPTSFSIELSKGVATITLDRPKRLNALTFEVYQELAETFENLHCLDEVRAVVITGRGRGFCSGGDQDDIIKHLLGRDTPGLVAFTRATGRLIGRCAHAGGRSSARSTASRSAPAP